MSASIVAALIGASIGNAIVAGWALWPAIHEVWRHRLRNE